MIKGVSKLSIPIDHIERLTIIRTVFDYIIRHCYSIFVLILSKVANGISNPVGLPIIDFE